MNADFNLVQEDPPPDARRGVPSPIFDNLLKVMKTPDTWIRIATYEKPLMARQVCYELRHGKRKSPIANWLFKYGPVSGSTDKYGVWARSTSVRGLLRDPIKESDKP